MPTALSTLTLAAAALAGGPLPGGPYLRPAGVGGAGGLRFELVNPTVAPIRFYGYRPDSFEGRLPPGFISPFYRAELLRGGIWAPHPVGRCGTGKGTPEVPAKSSAVFTVRPPGGEWEAIRVGVTLADDPARPGFSRVVWATALGR